MKTKQDVLWASKSEMKSPVWLKFKPIQDFMHVLVTCKIQSVLWTIQFTCLNRTIDNGGSVIPFLRNSLETKQIIPIHIVQSLTLIYGEKLGKRIGQKLNLPTKSELLKCLTSLLRRLHNTGAEFVDQTNKAFICNLQHGTIAPFVWCC